MENILDIITEEVHKYLFESVEVGDGIKFSEYKLKKRINYFRHNYYPTGKVTEDGDVDYWFDLIQPRVSTGVKNMRMDSKYFLVFSKNPIKDFPAVYIANTKLADWMEETHRSEEFNESTSEYYGTGNVLFRKIDRGYEVSDFLNTFLTNTTAKTVNETAVIERFYLTQSELRAKDGLYKNVEEVIEHCGNKFFSKTELGTEESKTAPIYELYRRTGEVSEEVLFKAQGKKGGKKEKFLLARFMKDMFFSPSHWRVKCLITLWKLMLGIIRVGGGERGCMNYFLITRLVITTLLMRCPEGFLGLPRRCLDIQTLGLCRISVLLYLTGL
jgi:hypothetical protein